MIKERICEIDRLRGIAIISVLFLHTLSNKFLDLTFDSIHIGQAVPIFLFVTFYLSFKNLDNINYLNKFDGILLSYYFSLKRVRRILRDIVLPFFLIVILQVSLFVINNFNSYKCTELIWRLTGVGPGSYYLWVYIQLYVLLPFMYLILKGNRLWLRGVIVWILCVFINFLVDKMSISAYVYRFLAIRYLFLSVPAFLLVDIEKNKKLLFPLWMKLGIILSFIYLTILKRFDLSPLILDLGWAGEQWPTYFWTYFAFIMLRKYLKKGVNNRFLMYLETLGKNSWYIFLVQMFILAYFDMRDIDFISNIFLRRICFVLLVFIISIIPVSFLFKNKNSYEKSLCNTSKVWK